MKGWQLVITVFLYLSLQACGSDDNNNETESPLSSSLQYVVELSDEVLDTSFAARDLSRLIRAVVEDYSQRAEDAGISQSVAVVSLQSKLSITIPFDCDSGSVSIVWGDNDNDSMRSIGDRFSFEFEQCYIQSQDTTLDGVLAATISAVIDLLPVSEIGLQLSINFDGLQITKQSDQQLVDGDISISPSAVVEDNTAKIALSLSGSRLSLQESEEQQASVLEDFLLGYVGEPQEISPYRLELDGALQTADFEGVLDFLTDPENPFTGLGSNPPETGSMTLSSESLVLPDNGEEVFFTATIEAIGEGLVSILLNVGTDTTWQEILNQ